LSRCRRGFPGSVADLLPVYNFVHHGSLPRRFGWGTGFLFGASLGCRSLGWKFPLIVKQVFPRQILLAELREKPDRKRCPCTVLVGTLSLLTQSCRQPERSEEKVSTVGGFQGRGAAATWRHFDNFGSCLDFVNLPVGVAPLHGQCGCGGVDRCRHL